MVKLSAIAALAVMILASCSRSEPPVLEDGILRLDDGDIDQTIAESTGFLLVHFSSYDPNCSFCVRSNDQVSMMIRGYADGLQLARITWEPWKSYADTSPATTEKYWIRGLPMLILYNNGKEVWRGSGHTNANYAKLTLLLDDCCQQ